MSNQAKKDAAGYINTSADDFKISLKNGHITTDALIEMYEQLKDSEGHKTRLNLVIKELMKRGRTKEPSQDNGGVADALKAEVQS